MPRPAFRKPWTHGARAYYEADTFAALRDGMKRSRKEHYVLMPNDGEAGLRPCATCGVALRDPYQSGTDTQSVWTWVPSRKAAYGQHSGCSWSSLIADLFDLADKGALV